MASAAVATLMTSCLSNEDPYNAGFLFRKPTYVLNAFFANNQVDTISFMSYGRWSVSRDETYSGSWCSFEFTQGKGNVLYTFPIHFEQNTTGQPRGAVLHFADTDHPGDARAMLQYWQYATRGDGTLGNAPDVKTIKGSDGSLFEFTYDAQHRPLTLRVTKEDALLHSLTLRFNDADSTLTVQDKSATLTSRYANDYQPERLIGTSDTVGYYSQYYSNGMPVSAQNAFNLEHRSRFTANSYYAFKLGGQSLNPDSLHMADSLRIATVQGDDVKLKKLAFHYSKADNRCQSVDVNQLVFGAEQCDPYQLLSLFRYCRSTSILSEVTTDNAAERIVVDAQLNVDHSVSRLTVTRQDGEITYTFEY